MKIGVIGTGNIGGTIAKKLRAAGHEVRVANDGGVEGVRQFAESNGLEPTDVVGAVSGVDVVVLSIPTPAIEQLPRDLFENAPDDLVVIDTGNYYPGMRDKHIEQIDSGMPESVWVSQQVGRSVIKAFNNALAETLANGGKPKGAPGRLAIAVAGDNADHKAIASSLVDASGFDPVDGGTLEDSWRQQPATPAYCCDFDAAAMREALSQAVRGVAEPKRDRLPELFAALGENPSHEQIVAMNRRVNAI